MKFKITASSVWKTEELIAKYPCLMNFHYEVLTDYKPNICMIKDETGKLIEYANGERAINTPIIHIYTLEDITNLLGTLNKNSEYFISVIISADEDIPSIEIYDDYRE